MWTPSMHALDERRWLSLSLSFSLDSQFCFVFWYLMKWFLCVAIERLKQEASSVQGVELETDNKKNWMSSAQLWISNTNSQFQSVRHEKQKKIKPFNVCFVLCLVDLNLWDHCDRQTKKKTGVWLIITLTNEGQFCHLTSLHHHHLQLLCLFQRQKYWLTIAAELSRVIQFRRKMWEGNGLRIFTGGSLMLFRRLEGHKVSNFWSQFSNSMLVCIDWLILRLCLLLVWQWQHQSKLEISWKLMV